MLMSPTKPAIGAPIAIASTAATKSLLIFMMNALPESKRWSRSAFVVAQPRVNGAQIAHLAKVTSGFPFSTIYVASSAALPLPTFFTAWIVPDGMNKTSPALSVTGGLPSS